MEDVVVLLTHTFTHTHTHTLSHSLSQCLQGSLAQSVKRGAVWYVCSAVSLSGRDESLRRTKHGSVSRRGL